MAEPHYVAHEPAGGIELDPYTGALLVLVQYFGPALVLAGWLLKQGRSMLARESRATSLPEPSYRSQPFNQQFKVIGICVLGLVVGGTAEYVFARGHDFLQGELALIGCLVTASAIAASRRGADAKNAILTGVVATVLCIAIFRDSVMLGLLEPPLAAAASTGAYLVISLGCVPVRLQFVRLLLLAVCWAVVAVAASQTQVSDPWLIRAAVAAPAASLLLLSRITDRQTSAWIELKGKPRVTGHIPQEKSFGIKAR